ncbi:MAG: hypothetical protein ACRDV0_09485 [Acidimicrobiales bacterium]
MSPDPNAWRDEIALREASLADARREHAAGELSDDELRAIEARESGALARARASLEAFALVEPAPAQRRVRRRSLLLIAFFAFLAALAVLLVATLTLRQPGSSDTGSISLSHAQRVTQLLDEAQSDTALGNVSAALAAYQGVLALDATNVVALTQTGWLDFSAGSTAGNAAVVTAGVDDLARAVALYPHDPAPRLYYAIVATSTPSEGTLAKSEWRVFLTLHPTPAQVDLATPYLAHYGLSG